MALHEHLSVVNLKYKLKRAIYSVYSRLKVLEYHWSNVSVPKLQELLETV